jgi:hypothetical protein
MAKPDPNDHWRRLAAELGLEVEPPSEPEPPAAAPESAAITPAERATETEAPPAEAFVTVSRVVERETIEVSWPTAEDPPPLPIEAAPPAEPEGPETASAEDSSADEAPRRRRRRSRRRKSEAPVAESEPTADADDDSPADVVKDWDIPSWNELIASLYRPDR